MKENKEGDFFDKKEKEEEIWDENSGKSLFEKLSEKNMEDINKLKEENRSIKRERDFYEKKINDPINFFKGVLFIPFIFLCVFLFEEFVSWILREYRNFDGFQWFEIVLGLSTLVSILWLVWKKLVKFDGESVAKKWYLKKIRGDKNNLE